VNTLQIETSFYKRRLQLNKACTDLGTPQYTKLDPNNIQDTVWVEKTHKVLFCGIPKVGSTFWKRTLTVLASGGKVASPFELRLSHVKLQHFDEFKSNLRTGQMESFLSGVQSFIFVRDPYSRLFSGYEHKLYNVNTAFWYSYGTDIVRTFRKNPSKQSLQFGHDITFNEFVKYILKQYEDRQPIDAHFSPMYEKCDPCGLPYDFIGHLETFKQDSEFLVNKWKEEFYDFTLEFGDFEQETALDTATALAGRLFSTWNKIKSELDYPLYNLVLRLWCDLQLRGYLSKDIHFPFKQTETDSLSQENVLNAIRVALHINVNKTAVKLQRNEALVQAYRTISLEDMERLRKYVAKDCQLFGYDDKPDALFNRTIPDKSSHLYLNGI
jgi:hypothetical protein